ncbi:outer membrane protein assembly factor [Pendulispora brunnea]|uniref:Outer membrane protein assembly factor n=1 Tax=Pendulispora brunnea TaxID=2905690 RepID=A0ABZ2KAB2_9BACT
MRATTRWGLAAVFLASSAARAEDVPPAPEGKLSVVPFVVPAYTPETSLLLGGAAVGVYSYPPEAGHRESQIMLAVAVTVKGQVALQLVPDVYLWNDRVQLGGVLGASRFPNVFYGLGSHTNEEDDEDYTPVGFEVGLSPKLRLLKGMYLGPDARFAYTNITETEAGGMLERGIVPGSGGGRSVEVGLAGFYDTRDSTIYPRDGHIIRVFARMARPALGSEFDYDVLSVDARKYISLPWADRHVLALQALAEIRDGAPPFYDLGLMGGDSIMRGYFRGRFRDRNYLAAQIEYRMPLFWRFGAVGFASLGQVSHTLSDVGDSPVRFAGGGGLRFAPLADVPVNLRLDIAYGDELRFYINVGEAF